MTVLAEGTFPPAGTGILSANVSEILGAIH